MIGKKKTVPKTSSAKNRQNVGNARKNAAQSGLRSTAPLKTAQKPPVKNPQNPQKSTVNLQKSQNPRNIPQNRVNQTKSGTVNGGLNKSAQIRPANPAKKPKKRFVLGKKAKKITTPASKGQTAKNSARSLPAKPVNEQARKAADRAAQAKIRAEAPEKKRPYRGGNYTLYFILAAIVVGIIMAILSNTVLFKCGTIEVVGTTRYTSEEIIAAAGINTGDNLLHIDAKKAENSVMNAFAFVDGVTVKKSYPTKIIIEITEAQNWFALYENRKKYVISRGGRVLGEISPDGLVVVKGFEAESLETGCWLNSTVDAKNKIVMEIFETAEKVGLQNITEIDITDRFSIKITVEDRIVLNLGSSVQLESKLRVGQALIEKEISEDEKVSVLLTNPEKVAVESLSHGQNPVQSTKPAQSTESSPEQMNSSPEEPAVAE